MRRIELLAVSALMFAARRIQNTIWYAACKKADPEVEIEGRSTLEAALDSVDDAKTLLEVVEKRLHEDQKRARLREAQPGKVWLCHHV